VTVEFDENSGTPVDEQFEPDPGEHRAES